MVWKDYSPSHFCGATGTFNGIDESIPGVPAREKCEPASVGEFWCALPHSLQCPMKGLPSAMLSSPLWGLSCPKRSPRPLSHVFFEELGVGKSIPGMPVREDLKHLRRILMRLTSIVACDDPCRVLVIMCCVVGLP